MKGVIVRFLRVGPAGAERPAVLDRDGGAFDLLPLTRDIDGAFRRQRRTMGRA